MNQRFKNKYKKTGGIKDLIIIVLVSTVMQYSSQKYC